MEDYFLKLLASAVVSLNKIKEVVNNESEKSDALPESFMIIDDCVKEFWVNFHKENGMSVVSPSVEIFRIPTDRKGE